jgi:hypothetical protein
MLRKFTQANLALRETADKAGYVVAVIAVAAFVALVLAVAAIASVHHG